MKKYIDLIRNNHQGLYKLLLFGLTIGFIVYFLPREVKFKFEIQEGKPWLHEDLIAGFDFSIKKTNAEIEKERELIMAQAKSYYYKDTSVVSKQLIVFQNEFETAKNSFIIANEPGLVGKIFGAAPDSMNFSFLKSEGFRLLNKLYTAGIVQLSDEDRQAGQAIYILRDNVAEEYELKSLYDIRKAAAEINQLTVLDQQEKAFLAPLLVEALAYNTFYDKNTTKKDLESQLSQISIQRGLVYAGALIIGKGEIVNDDKDKLQKLLSYKEEFEARNSSAANKYLILFGQLLLVTICIMVLYFFLNRFREDLIEDSAGVSLILFNMVFVFGIARLCVYFNPSIIYAMPFCILPLILRAFFDTRLALFTHLIAILLVGFLVPNSFEFIFIQLLAGIVSILTIVDLYKRSHLFISAFKIVIIYVVAYFGIAITQNNVLEELEWINFAYFAVSGFLTLFAYPLIYAYEKMFGLVSDVSLLELSDTNSPLLRELAEKAPGTFQHSLQVANLAESAVIEIDGNALLARTGALYHDIGKLDHPMYFIENQSTGVNPHDELSFDESAMYIIDHVINGIERAKKANLPDRIIDFIRTHHGTSTVQYFYRQYVNSFPEGELDKSSFSYPGPKPFSKETAVLMMADSVEAASRSLKNPDALAIDKLVEQIIESQMKDGQFNQAAITFKDINLIKKIFKKKLMNIYHLRIEYPD